MIVSRGRGYIFVHIPKTGGTSMALALEARAHADDLLIGDTPKALRRRGRLKGLRTAGRLWKHSTLADLPGLVSEAEMARMFVFTLVRNPWDRVFSSYHWLRGQKFGHPAVARARALSFEGFVCAPQTRAALAANPYGRHVTLPSGREHCQAFVRLEHLVEDLAPVTAHLGFALDLPRVNRSTRPEGWQEDYSAAAAACVADSCAADIARFGYAFAG